MNDKKKQSRGGDNKNNNPTKKKRSRGRSRSRSKRVDPVKYWGQVDMLPEPDEHVISTPDPSVVVNSLGRPPIPGHENASKHYFNLVYDRATSLAVALAAAGGLSDFGIVLDDDDLDDEDELDDELDGNKAGDTTADDGETADAGTGAGQDAEQPAA